MTKTTGIQGKASSSAGQAFADAARSVLVVDDEASVRNIMRRWLESRGYHVALAMDAEQALERLASQPLAVAICDLRMPGRGGLWLTDQLRREYPDTAVIIATGVNDVSAAVEGLRQGVVDYLTKPFDRDRLFDAVARALEWHRAASDSRRWREMLEGEMRERQSHLETIIAGWPVDSEQTLDAMLSAVTAENMELYAHGYRVAAMSGTLARALGLTDAEIEMIEHGGLLHDLGKLVMPEAVLRKPAPLTAEEQRLIRLHPRLGAALIERIPYLSPAASIVRDAQERPDGLGYPMGSRGNTVWMGARIVAVADAYDTMTRARVFRDAMTPAAALAELSRCAGTQFDSRVVQAFTEMVDS
jgi:response regulator RpfG family c-di-GMP phosphodiesterase